MSLVEKFFDYIPKLTAVEFAGLARVLKVQLMDEVNPTAEQLKDRFAPRSFTDVLNDMLKAFEKSDRKRKKEIIQLVKAATKAPRSDVNAGDSQDS